ncbi:BgtTE-56070 [Blumeria graminis f. sp. tritici]|uniref:BgtTE-56070 n=1 Tax=Blumeria graminis f. sp. tritici TaxID=62690 RepID=A0A9X9MJD1_BLUGR|nr:BgtTE-56070 [Blumeria graminis f. sp. tritici]
MAPVHIILICTICLLQPCCCLNYNNNNPPKSKVKFLSLSTLLTLCAGLGNCSASF